MLTVSQVIKEGMEAYRTVDYNEVLKDNPYDPPTLSFTTEYKPVYNRYSRRYSQVKCRVKHQIDYSEIWQLGWNLAEYLEQRNAGINS